ncbi:MAG: tRNA (adenosine(37)-N6)-dimethylallyltransferase MiaA [bacterium]|nr:tRNA (adenosine(37)-N6)-dimethylallyltransferase MiaA [bacterium]
MNEADNTHLPAALPRNLLVVCGATASGKTRLGVALARRYGGEIISVDSRQVYRGLDIGSGKDLAEYQTPDGSIPYHLIDIAGPQQVYSLWNYLQDFDAAFADITDRGRLPVVVGGTGLYLEAVLRGYEVPQEPADEGLRAELMRQSPEQLEERLRQLAPERYRNLDTSGGKRRLVRALEVALAEARAGTLRAATVRAELRPLVLTIRWDRAVLRQRVATRLDERLAAGLVEEVQKLLDAGIPIERLDQLGMEFRHVGHYLLGDTTPEQMRADLLQAIGQLVKRQDTYFRGMERRGTPMHWLDGDDLAAAMAIVDRSIPG